jgi:hypothetical protein
MKTMVVVMLAGFIKKTPWSESASQTTPTERPSFVGEVITNFCG